MALDGLSMRLLADGDAHILAPLIASYAQMLRRGAPRRPDEYYAETLLQDQTAEVLGAFRDKQLVGFTIFFDLPEAISGRRTGQLDDLFIEHQHRGLGISSELVNKLVEIGKTRNWTYLRWLVSEKNDIAMRIYSSLAEPAAFKSFVIPVNPSNELSA
ncbi:MAG: GNAT family N-acetyltransferase [Hyphomicrobiales bacterium]